MLRPPVQYVCMVGCLHSWLKSVLLHHLPAQQHWAVLGTVRVNNACSAKIMGGLWAVLLAATQSEHQSKTL